MRNLLQIKTLVLKEIKLEFRQKYAIGGLLIYMASTIIVCYVAFNARPGSMSLSAWNALYWIIVLFTCINAIGKSFVFENRGQFHYLYQLTNPRNIILSKITYNTLIVIFLMIVGTIIFFIILGNRVTDNWLFFVIVLLTSSGLSGTLTLVSSIANKAQNTGTLMTVLSLPILVPLLVMMVKAGKNAIDGIDRSASLDEIVTLFALNLLVLALSVILFPYLWKN